MSQWIIKNRITNKGDLIKFDLKDIIMIKKNSTDLEPIFLRNELLK